MNDFNTSSQFCSRPSVPLASFERPIRAVVIGASGGIGNALVCALAQNDKVKCVQALSRASITQNQLSVQRDIVDLGNENSIAASANRVANRIGEIDLIIVASGFLHDGSDFQPEKSLRALNTEALQRAFAVNTIGPLLVAKHFLPLLNRESKSVFAALSARVGSIEDNRLGGWYGYRASKAALNMSIRNLAIELTRTHPFAICLALHPGTVDTKLSRPFARSVRHANLHDPVTCANNLLDVIDMVTVKNTGGFYAYDGSQIPY